MDSIVKIKDNAAENKNSPSLLRHLSGISRLRKEVDFPISLPQKEPTKCKPIFNKINTNFNFIKYLPYIYLNNSKIMKRKLPQSCPSCSSLLEVKTLRCEACGTQIDGAYPLPVLARLSHEDQAFVLEFVKNSGSLKEMAKTLGLSYPTVRNVLDDLIGRIQALENSGGKAGEA